MKPSQYAAGALLGLIGYAVCNVLEVYEGIGVAIGFMLGYALTGAFDDKS
jgi:uncharacterized membrane protein (Fun14 family)